MMHHTSRRTLFVFALIVFAIGPVAEPAFAQSENDLRRENQRLTTQLREANRELDAARNRIAELERQVAILERALTTQGDRPSVPSPQDDQVTIDESEPSASPRALLRALVKDYEEAVEEMEIGREGDRERALYMRALNRWQAAAARKYRSQVRWRVRVESETATRQGYDLQLVAVDPVTHVQLGDPFEVSLPRGMSRRYEALRDRGDMETLELRGTLLPRVTINPDRQTSGPFDNPRLIGPFAEFGFTVEPRSLLAAGEDDV